MNTFIHKDVKIMLKIQLWLTKIDILKYGKNRTPLFKVSQYYSYFCISDQINAALMIISDLFWNHKKCVQTFDCYLEKYTNVKLNVV